MVIIVQLARDGAEAGLELEAESTMALTPLFRSALVSP